MAKYKEQWRPIKDFEDKYEVSNRANVRSIKTGLTLKPMMAGDLYPYFIFYENKKGVKRRVKLKLHRLVALHWVANPYFYKDVNHLDGDKLNNLPENLEWCTKSQNLKHAFATGLKTSIFVEGGSKGELNVNAKLSYDKADDIRAKYFKGRDPEGICIEDDCAAVAELAEEYEVGVDTIYKILKNKAWVR